MTDTKNTPIIRKHVTIEPFLMSVLPDQMDRFSIIVISSPTDPILYTFIQYLINSGSLQPLDKAGERREHSSQDLRKSSYYDISQQFTVGNKEELQNKLVIIDASTDFKFRAVPSAVHVYNDISPRWLNSYYTRKIINPNMRLYSPNIEWNTNISHSIWLSDTIDNIPPCLFSNCKLIFILDSAMAEKYLRKYMKAESFRLDDDSIFVLSSTLEQDNKLMMLSRDRFEQIKN